MAKKTLKKKVQTKQSSSKLAAPVVDSAREIWLAGLGAFSVAQKEGGKLIEQGNKLFEKLVAEGSKLETKTRKAAEKGVDGIRDEVGSKVESVRQQATDNWDRLEAIFEDRVARVLGRLGVPTADDVNKLSARVQNLATQVNTLARNSKPKAAAKPKKTAKRKASTKKSAAKKATTKAPVKKAATKSSTASAAS